MGVLVVGENPLPRDEFGDKHEISDELSYQFYVYKLNGLIRNAVYVLNGMKCRERQNSSLGKGFLPTTKTPNDII